METRTFYQNEQNFLTISDEYQAVLLDICLQVFIFCSNICKLFRHAPVYILYTSHTTHGLFNG